MSKMVNRYYILVIGLIVIISCNKPKYLQDIKNEMDSYFNTCSHLSYNVEIYGSKQKLSILFKSTTNPHKDVLPFEEQKEFNTFIYYKFIRNKIIPKRIEFKYRYKAPQNNTNYTYTNKEIEKMSEKYNNISYENLVNNTFKKIDPEYFFTYQVTGHSVDSILSDRNPGQPLFDLLYDFTEFKCEMKDTSLNNFSTVKLLMLCDYLHHSVTYDNTPFENELNFLVNTITVCDFDPNSYYRGQYFEVYQKLNKK